MKVSELAKELNLTSKNIIEYLTNEGFEVKAATSVLSDEMIEKVKSNVENVQKTIANKDSEKVSVESPTPVANTVSSVPTAPKKTVRKFEPSDLIPCRSVRAGELLLPGKKSKLLYIWSGVGDTTEVEFQDLQALRSTRSHYIYDPLFIIEDEELLELWKRDLVPVYQKISGLDDLESVFDLPVDDFKEELKSFSVGIQNTIKIMAAEKVQNGVLDSLAKIKIIDEVLDTDLMTYISK